MHKRDNNSHVRQHESGNEPKNKSCIGEYIIDKLWIRIECYDDSMEFDTSFLSP